MSTQILLSKLSHKINVQYYYKRDYSFKINKINVMVYAIKNTISLNFKTKFII